MGVRGTFALCEDVLDADALENSTHSTTGDDTSTRSCGLEEDASTTVLASLLVGDSTLQDGNLDEVLLGIIDTLLDGSLDFLGLAKTVSNDTILISNNNDSREAESSTTLGNLGYATDCDKTIVKVDLA